MDPDSNPPSRLQRFGAASRPRLRRSSAASRPCLPPSGESRPVRRVGRGLSVAVTDRRGRPVAAGGLGRWLSRVAPASARGEVVIALVSDAEIRKLNREYRLLDKPTDVLSFPSVGEPLSAGRSPLIAKPKERNADRGSRSAGSGQQRAALGDIAIATGVARRQAKAGGHSYDTELRVLALHGLLHLLGYDHEDPADNGRMARVEARLRRKGGLREGLIARMGRSPQLPEA